MAGWGRFEEAEARNQELETGREKGRRGGGVAAFLIFGQSRRGTPNDGGMGIRCGTKIGRNPNLTYDFWRNRQGFRQRRPADGTDDRCSS